MKKTSLFLGLLFLIITACNGGSSNSNNKNPIASFQATPSGLTVSFDASASSDSDGSISKYAWNFGDSQLGTGKIVSHTYKNAGNFQVTLTVTDNGNLTGTTNQTISVTGSSNSGKGTISGRLGILSGLSASQDTSQTNADIIPQLKESDLHDSNIGWQHHPEAEFVPGDVIVKFKEGLQTTQLSLNSSQYSVAHVRALAGDIAELYRNSGLNEEATLELIKELNQRDDVLYAAPNYIDKAARVPNDEFYKHQWHYPLSNLPKAWDITIGSASTIVGVVDSGILVDLSNPNDPNVNHPDFAGKVLPGYDFISDPRSALDGDGRDPNPFDPILSNNKSGFHGSHVAGTIAAATNNKIGVAGINWQAKILPVRVLGGEGSGPISDIAEGALWAAGLDPNIANPNPASVINISIGGPGSCHPFYQEVFDKIIAAGKIIIVAAGNENKNVADSRPANCRGAISVGAVDLVGTRAPYSNFGSRIDIMAPGGNTSADLNKDNFADGVLSTFFDLSTKNIYGFYQGTSMAAPHVAGVISLMKALKPNLTSAQALAALSSTAKPLSAAQCNSSGCGAGLIDAFAALQAIKDGSTGGEKGVLNFNPQALDFGSITKELDLGLRNSGNGSIKYSVTHFVAAKDNPANAPDGIIFRVSGSTSGSLSKGQSTTLRLGVKRDLLTATGLYQLGLVFEVDDGQAKKKVTLLVRITKLGKANKLSGPMIVAAFIDDGNNDFKESGFQTSQGVISTYKFEALTGNNYIIAWSDENKNIKIDTGDFIGVYPRAVNIVAGQEKKGVDIVLGPYTDNNSLSTQQITVLESFQLR